MQPCGDRDLDDLSNSLRNRMGFGGRTSPPAEELDLACDGEHRSNQERAKLLRSLYGGIRRRREHDQVRAAGGRFVPLATAPDLRGLLLRTLRVARADHDVVARLGEALGEREPEVAGASDDGDFHSVDSDSGASG